MCFYFLDLTLTTHRNHLTTRSIVLDMLLFMYGIEFGENSNFFVSAPRTPEREALTKMGALSVGSPSTTPAPRTQSCPSPAAVTKDARSRDNKGSLPGDQTPTSSHRSSPFSSKTSSPQSFKRKSEAQPKPSVEGVFIKSKLRTSYHKIINGWNVQQQVN